MRSNASTLAILAGAVIVAACAKKNEATPGAAADSGAAAKVFCGGVNECSAKSACKTPKHACAGKNECKGQGIVEMTEAECRAKGGSVQPNMM